MARGRGVQDRPAELVRGSCPLDRPDGPVGTADVTHPGAEPVGQAQDSRTVATIRSGEPLQQREPVHVVQQQIQHHDVRLPVLDRPQPVHPAGGHAYFTEPTQSRLHVVDEGPVVVNHEDARPCHACSLDPLPAAHGTAMPVTTLDSESTRSHRSGNREISRGSEWDILPCQTGWFSQADTQVLSIYPKAPASSGTDGSALRVTLRHRRLPARRGEGADLPRRNHGEGNVTTTGYDQPSRPPRRLPRAVLLMLIGLLLAGCLGTQTDPPTPAPTVPPTHTVPTATETPIGEAEPAPLEESILMLRRARDGAVLGAAIVVTADGFLLTTAVTGTDGVEIVTPDGTALRPVQVARDDATGLTLLKIPVSGRAPVRLRRDAPPAGDSVVAVGYDAARGAFAQAGGHVTAPGAATATPGTEPTPLQTDIPLVEGFAGGALADPAGAVLGIIVPAVDSNGSRVSAALPAAYLAEWFEQWRAAQRAAVDESAGWPVLDAAGALTLRYPEGWSIAQASGGERDYRA